MNFIACFNYSLYIMTLRREKCSCDVFMWFHDNAKKEKTIVANIFGDKPLNVPYNLLIIYEGFTNSFA